MTIPEQEIMNSSGTESFYTISDRSVQDFIKNHKDVEKEKLIEQAKLVKSLKSSQYN